MGFLFLFLFLFFPGGLSADKHSRPKPLNIEEEQFMRVFYEKKLQEVCNNFHFPHKIQVCGLSLTNMKIIEIIDFLMPTFIKIGLLFYRQQL